MNPESRAVLPPIAFRSFAQSYTTPELSEGFEDITTINFEVSNLDVILMSGQLTQHSSKALTLSERSGQSTGYQSTLHDRCKDVSVIIHMLIPEASERT